MLDKYGDDARLMAGGTALVLQMQQRFAQPEHVIGLRQLRNTPGLRDIEINGDSLTLGALATLGQLEDSPLLRDRIPMLAHTIHSVATRRIRSMATLGGALANGDPNQDPPPALIALGATVQLVSKSASRVCPVEELFVDYYETDVRPGEMLASVSIPLPVAGQCGAYVKFLPRTADDYATVSVAVTLRIGADDACEDSRIVLGAAGMTPIRALAAEELLRGNVLDDGVIRAAAAAVPDAVDPLDDFRGSADYKREMAGVFTRRAILQALDSRQASARVAA